VGKASSHGRRGPVASKFKRNARWYVSFQDEMGRWRKKSVGTEQLADEFLRAHRHSRTVFATDPQPAVAYPFPAAAQDYLRRLSIYGKPASIKHATISIKHLSGSLDAADLNSIHSSVVDKYVLHRRREGVCDRTINGELIVLRAVLNHAVHTGQLKRVPFKVRLLKITKKLPKTLNPEQVEVLLRHADHRTRPILITALHTGFRSQELIALNWSDVDFHRRTIAVTAKPRIGFSPKAHVERANPMSQRLYEVLKEHKESLLHSTPDDPVFQMKAGVRWTARLTRVINRVFRDAALYSRAEKSGLHQCRKTYATTLLDSGVSIEAVRSLGGWASLGIVQTYVTSADRIKREAVEQLPF
jgi:integrase